MTDGAMTDGVAEAPPPPPPPPPKEEEHSAVASEVPADEAQGAEVPTETAQTRTLRVAAVGCLHGELDAVYRTIAYADAQCGRATDLVLICGDVQASRDARDLASMSVATFRRRFGDFQAYHDGRKRAPVLTLVVGGNHEASLHFWDLYHGGWLAPNIFYLGTAAVVRCRGLRVAGVSGIAKPYDFARGYACPPPDPAADPVRFENWCHSVYHLRAYEFFRLGTLAAPRDAPPGARLDVVLSHDWPAGMALQGDTATLYRNKTDFRAEARTLGSPALRDLLARMEPRYWFAAHHHVKHAVLVHHPRGTETRFLALSKVLPRYDFLQLLDITVPDGGGESGECSTPLAYDLEWLHSVHATASLFPVGERQSFAFPAPGSPEARAFALAPGDVRVTDPAALADLLRVPPCSTTPGCVVDAPAVQQQRFLELLQTLFGPFPLHPPFEHPQHPHRHQCDAPVFQQVAPNPEEIPIDCGDGEGSDSSATSLLPASSTANPEEIPLDCGDGEDSDRRDSTATSLLPAPSVANAEEIPLDG